jgi:hypothetical protein
MTFIYLNKVPQSKAVSADTLKVNELFERVKENQKQSKVNDQDEKEDITNKIAIENSIFADLDAVTKGEDAEVKIEIEKPTPQVDTNLKTLSVESSVSTQSLNSSQQLTTTASMQQLDLNRSQSNQSIASTLTNSSQKQANISQTSSRNRGLNNEDTNEDIPAWIKENVCVIVTTNSVMNKRGHVRFIGPTKFGTGTWIGVELDQSAGKNDGSVKGVRYFSCVENRGVFVRADKLTQVIETS